MLGIKNMVGKVSVCLSVCACLRVRSDLQEYCLESPWLLSCPYIMLLLEKKCLPLSFVFIQNVWKKTDTGVIRLFPRVNQAKVREGIFLNLLLQ